MGKKVVIATAYDMIFTGLLTALQKNALEVVALITRKGATSAFANTLSTTSEVDVFELPMPQGEISIAKAMQHNIEYQNIIMEQVERIKEINFDYMVAWGINVLPNQLIELPSDTAVNVHPSDLPNYRGGFPLQSQLLNMEKHLRVTIHKTTSDVDKGHIYAKSTPIDILDDDTMSSLAKRVVPIGSQLLADIVLQLSNGIIPIYNEDNPLNGNKHAWGIYRPAMLQGSDGHAMNSNYGVLGEYRIHWNIDSVNKIERQCRAFDMMGGPFTSLNGHCIHFNKVTQINNTVLGDPGEVYECTPTTMTVQAIDGVIEAHYTSKSDVSKCINEHSNGKIKLDLSVSVENVTGILNSDRIYTKEAH